MKRTRRLSQNLHRVPYVKLPKCPRGQKHIARWLQFFCLTNAVLNKSQGTGEFVSPITKDFLGKDKGVALGWFRAASVG
ncbi:MAG: hypothetical protein AAF958_17885, partial [Planctomycetota bacterium]